MSRGGLATDPERRMGVYKRLADVPDRYRLHRFAAAYDGRDVWTEYVEEQIATRDLGEWFRDEVGRVGRRWKAHMDERGRHHALATPDDVEAWAASLVDDLALTTAYEKYWMRVEDFYWWLQFHTEHPHRYHPVLMAAADGEASGEVWAYKVQLGRDTANQRGES